MRQALYNGNKVNAEPIEFEVRAEPYIEYKLADGTILKIKNVLTEVVKLEGVYLDNGEPVYQIMTASIQTTRATADNMRNAKPVVGKPQ